MPREEEVWGTRGSRTILWPEKWVTQRGMLWTVWGGYDWDLLLSTFHHSFWVGCASFTQYLLRLELKGFWIYKG